MPSSDLRFSERLRLKSHESSPETDQLRALPREKLPLTCRDAAPGCSGHLAPSRKKWGMKAPASLGSIYRGCAPCWHGGDRVRDSGDWGADLLGRLKKPTLQGSHFVSSTPRGHEAAQTGVHGEEAVIESLDRAMEWARAISGRRGRFLLFLTSDHSTPARDDDPFRRELPIVMPASTPGRIGAVLQRGRFAGRRPRMHARARDHVHDPNLTAEKLQG